MRLILLLLCAMPVLATETPSWTDKEVTELVEKLQERRAAEYQWYVEQLKNGEHERMELERKLDAMRGKYECS